MNTMKQLKLFEKYINGYFTKRDGTVVVFIKKNAPEEVKVAIKTMYEKCELREEEIILL